MRTVRIPLHSRKHPGLFAIVDECDSSLVGEFHWRPAFHKTNVYAKAWAYLDGKRTCVLMHRVVMGMGKGDPDLDHENGNGLDNRRSNLRPCNPSQNAANRRVHLPHSSSTFRGVTWNKKSGKWQASIKVSGRNIYLGLFTTEQDAARAYDDAAVEHFGTFARLNFVERQAAA